MVFINVFHLGFVNVRSFWFELPICAIVVYQYISILRNLKQ